MLVRMADGTTKRIEQIHAGELVASYDRVTNTMVTARVTGVLVHGPESSAEGFIVVHGPMGDLRVTPNHPLIIDGKIQRADAMRAGSYVVTPGSLRNTPATLAAGVLDVSVRSEVVSQVERVPGNGEHTYDLKVDGPGTFFIMGMMSNQKR